MKEYTGCRYDLTYSSFFVSPKIVKQAPYNINLAIPGSLTNHSPCCTAPYSTSQSIEPFMKCMFPRSDSMWYPRSEMLFLSFCLLHVRKKGRVILLDFEQTFGALQAVMVATMAVAVVLYALSDAVYLLCATIDLGLPVRARISELFIFQLCPLRDYSRY